MFQQTSFNLTKKQIDDFQRDGAVFLPKAFDGQWIEKLTEGATTCLRVYKFVLHLFVNLLLKRCSLMEIDIAFGMVFQNF